MSIGTLDYFKFKKFALKTDFNFRDFFREYSKYYVQSPHDFLTISKDYYNIMLHLKNKLNYKSDDQKECFDLNLMQFCKSQHRSLNPKHVLTDQTPFVSVVSTLISSNNKVLDVGGGKVPYSSILMKDYFEKVGSIDTFSLSEEALATTGIQPKHGYFDEIIPYVMPAYTYDFIVGSKPCSAIQSIVENCHNNNKGYIIKLCDCDLYKIANKNNDKYKEWEEILPEIDPNVKFYEYGEFFIDHGHYAYNIDATEEQFAKVVEETRNNDISSLKNSVFGELKEYALEHPVDLPPEITPIY